MLNESEETLCAPSAQAGGFLDFDRAFEIERTATHAFWWHDRFLGVALMNRMDDEASRLWRDSLSAQIARRGPPSWIAVDAESLSLATSLTTRFQTAVFSRKLAKKALQVLVLTSNAELPILRTIVRVAGVDELRLTTQRSEFVREVQAMLHLTKAHAAGA